MCHRLHGAGKHCKYSRSGIARFATSAAFCLLSVLLACAGEAGASAHHLVYTTVGSDADYIKLTKWLVLSINHYSTPGSFEFLVICDTASSKAAQSVIPEAHLNFKVDYLVLDPAVVDRLDETPAWKAASRKLDIWRYPRINEFTHILFFDADYEVTLDVTELLSKQLQPGILYANIEQRTMLETRPEEQHRLHKQWEWSLSNYTEADIQRFHQHNIVVFNSGCFMFMNTPEMLQDMRATKDIMKTFQGKYFGEQPFINYYFNTRLRSNTSLMSPYLLEWQPSVHAKGRFTYHNKVIHFTFSGSGAERNHLMQHFYHHEVIGQRHAKFAVTNTWLDTITAFAMETDKRGSWPPHMRQVPRQHDRYYTLASKHGIKTICGIGFRADSSVAVFLAANPFATAYVFDTMEQPYARRAVLLLHNLLPDMFNYVAGTPTQTVPWLHKARPGVQCDLFLVNGNDQGYQGALTDFLNAHAMMPLGATLVADDLSYRFSTRKQAWAELAAAGYLTHGECEQPEPLDANAAGTFGKRWCWASVAKPRRQLSVPINASVEAFSINTLPTYVSSL